MSPLALDSLGGALPPQFSLGGCDDAEPGAAGDGAGGGGAAAGGGEESSAGAVDMWACGCVLACLLWRAGAGSPSHSPSTPPPHSRAGLPPLGATGGCLPPLAGCPSDELRAVLEARSPTPNPFTVTQPCHPYPKPKPNPN